MATTWRLAMAGLLCVACQATAPVPPTAPKSATRADDAPAWADFSAKTFARAKRERKYIVMDGSAEWCHWCHVMEATTYRDPSVRKLLDERFIAVKVDIDTRPDLQERYSDYGWPATVLFDPEAGEIGKYRGYLAPEDFVAILRDVVTNGTTSRVAGADPGRSAGSVSGTTQTAPKEALSEEALARIAKSTEIALDGYWDDIEGGWGQEQKAPLGWNNAWLLSKAERSAPEAKEEKEAKEAKRKVLFTLDKQSKLIDPVWGGIYQYSGASDWDHAHFEKLMTFQAPALENYAMAYRLSGDPKALTRARAIYAYVDRFLKSPEGSFFATQDADLNAHERDKPFLPGAAYYALGERDRLAKGLPRIDTHEYGRENGLAIAAYVTMYEITKDAAVLAAAVKAAQRVLATHDPSGGGITHDVFDPAKPPKQRFLSDNATFGLGLMRLFEITGDAGQRDRASAIADFMLSDLRDEDGGGFFASTKDPDAVGVFAVRRVPFEENVVALRFFARLARATHDPKYRVAIDRVIRAISRPEEINARGRMLGDYLLALEETRDVRGAAK